MKCPYCGSMNVQPHFAITELAFYECETCGRAIPNNWHTHMAKQTEIPCPESSKISGDGLPLSAIKDTEKLVASVSCKLYPSLADWVHEKGGSTFLRQIIEKAKLEEEKFEMLEDLIHQEC